MSWLPVIVIAIAAVLAAMHLQNHLTRVFQPNKPPLENNLDSANCQLVAGPGPDSTPSVRGSEDFARAKHGIVFASSLDGDLFSDHSASGCHASAGGLYALNIDSDTVVPHRVPLEDKVSAFPYITHGLFYSQSSDRLYVVAHRKDYSSVDVFTVVYDKEAPSDPARVRLVLQSSVQDPSLFPRGGINDVVEGATPRLFFVTQWLAFDMPAKGLKFPNSFQEKVAAALSIPLFLVGARPTRVLVCEAKDGGSEFSCADATGRVFQGANGITTNGDRSLVYINDPLDRHITAMKPVVQGDGSTRLETQFVIDVPHALDNLDYIGHSGALLAGIMPNITTVVNNLGVEPGEPKEQVQGGAMLIEPGADPSDGSSWTSRVVGAHDGSLLSQVSAAIFQKTDQTRGRILLGSPHNPGILVCDV